MTHAELTIEFLKLKARVDANDFSDRFVMPKTFQFLDGRNIQLGTTNGTKIGTATNQKIAFFGSSPVAQQSGISAPSGGATIDSQSRTAVTSLINTLRTFGFTT